MHDSYNEPNEASHNIKSSNTLLQSNSNGSIVNSQRSVKFNELNNNLSKWCKTNNLLCSSIFNNENIKSFLFHFGLVSFCCCYVIVGAIIFRFIERPVEVMHKENIKNSLEYESDLFIKEIDSIMNKDNELFETTVKEIIDDYQFFIYENLEHSVKENYFRSMYYNNGTYIDLWTLPMAILFTSTTIIPVGFGYIAPVTTIGRVLVLVYSIIGLPLALITLSDISKFFCSLLFRCLKNSLQWTIVAMIVLLSLYPIIATCLIYEASGLHLSDCFYFCIASMFTIGFGDILPNISLFYLIIFIITGVLLVTAAVDLLASGIIHNIHFLGRRMFKIAQGVSFDGVLETGLTQLNALANISVSSILNFLKPPNLNVLSSIVTKCEVSAYEPSIPLDYVDKIDNFISSQNNIDEF